ncbi:hypothetical protein [Kribbella deserti]|uniref:Uncharacterized protein n=1 Tax=Kribbella deserti TaxID=1926257 RepID=A0ABV6QF87_9ACTN
MKGVQQVTGRPNTIQQKGFIMTERPFIADQSSPLAAVWEGMAVVDATGAVLGKVEYVKLGDPGAVTTEGQVSPDGDGLFAAFARALTGVEPQVARQTAERLIRTGFCKVDGKGLLDRDLYVAADQIAYVEEDHVRLAVTSDDVPAER